MASMARYAYIASGLVGQQHILAVVALAKYRVIGPNGHLRETARVGLWQCPKPAYGWYAGHPHCHTLGILPQSFSVAENALELAGQSPSCDSANMDPA